VALAATAIAPITYRASAAASASAITDVKIAAKGWVLSAPAHIPAGLVRFTVNGSTSPMGTMAIVAALNPGVSQANAIAALKSGDEKSILQVLTPLGGPAGTGTPQTILSLKAGSYVAFDVEQDAKGNSHASYSFFTVAPSSAPVVDPASTVTVTELDMKFRVAATVPAGNVTLKIVNRGPSIHETILAKLHAGTTLDDLKAYLKQQNPSGPPPVDVVGIGALMASGHTQWAQSHLTPGTYVLLCFVPDKHGVPHVMDGMIKSFEVR
jgi:hypothetical protein